MNERDLLDLIQSITLFIIGIHLLIGAYVDYRRRKSR